MTQPPGDGGIDAALFLVHHAFEAEVAAQLDALLGYGSVEHEHGPQRAFHIDGAQAVHQAILYFSAKRRFGPDIVT
jgi:hypothetical protein